MHYPITDYVMTATYLTVLPLYIWALFYLQGRKRRRKLEAKFCKGVIAIIQSTNDPQQRISQIATLYRRISEGSSNFSKTFRNPVDLLENLVVNIDTISDKEFKEKYKADIPTQWRSELIRCLHLLKTDNPYSQISSKEGNLLSTIVTALNTNNVELGVRTVTQLSEELEGIDSKLRSEGKRNTNAYIITVVSAILTLFFGILSLGSFFKS